MSKGKFAVLSIVSVILVFALAGGLVYYFDDSFDKVVDVTPDETQVVETQAPTEAETESNYALELLSTMSLEEKVAQMMMVSCHEGINIEAASSYGVGGLCLYGYSFEEKTTDEVISMIESYQDLVNVPMLVSTDEEGGTVVRVSSNLQLRESPFLSPSELFAEGGMDLVESDTLEKASLLLSLGINVNLAPVCDVPLSEDNYIYDRCFSLNANETSDYVKTVVSAMRVKGIGSTLKHFPGYGGSVDTHESMSYDNRDYSAFENGDFKPSDETTRAQAAQIIYNLLSFKEE